MWTIPKKFRRVMPLFIPVFIVSLLGTLSFVQASAAEDGLQVKWEQRYITEETRELVKAVIPSPDGGAVVWADMTDTNWRIKPPKLLKADASGKQIWTKVMPEGFFMMDVMQAKEGGFILMGALDSDPENLQIIKLTEAGKTQWTKLIPVEGGAFIPRYYLRLFYDMVQTDAGGFIVIGRKYLDEGLNNSVPRIMKITRSGEVEWDKLMDQSSLGQLTLSNRGDIFVAGSDSSSIYIAKMDQDGNFLWENSYEESEIFTIKDIKPTKDDGLALTGYVNRYKYDPVFNDILAMKIDKDGSLEWKKYYGEEEIGVSLTETDDDGYMLFGKTRTEANDSANWTFLKLDQSGNKIWDQTAQFEQVHGVSAIPSKKGEYILAGEAWEFDGTFPDKRDISLIKVDKPKTVKGKTALFHVQVK